jgi:hypothetical protein
MEAPMGTLVALVFLLSCGPPADASDCLMRCDDCEPSCKPDRSWWAPGQDQPCDDECNIDNDMWGCEVEDGECVAVTG